MSELHLAVRGAVATASDTFRADVGVRDGRIVSVAAAIGGARREIDATGLLVASGWHRRPRAYCPALRPLMW
jgi:dihydropyrimidinase